MKQVFRALLMVVLALSASLALVGLPLLMLETPPMTAALSSAFSYPSGPDATARAELARRFVVWGGSDVRALTVAAFGEEATGHLDDVHSVLAAGSACALLALLSGVAAAVSLTRMGEHAAIRRSLRSGAVGVVVLAALCALAAAVDFERFFGAFHGLFFAQGTWLFPADSPLIETFPEPFWMWAGGLWAGLVAVLCAALWLLAGRVRARSAAGSEAPVPRGDGAAGA